MLSRYSDLPPIIRFSIDDGPLAEYNMPSLPIEGDALLFFQSAALSPTTHKVVANTTRTTADTPFLLDYITVLPVGAVIPSLSSQPSLSTALPSSSLSASLAGPSGSQPLLSTAPISMTSAASSATSNTWPSPSSIFPSNVSTTTTSNTSSAASNTSQASRSINSQGAGRTLPNAGPIAGGVIGGIAIAIIALLGLWWRHRKRNRIFCSHTNSTARTTVMQDVDSILAYYSSAYSAVYCRRGWPLIQLDITASLTPDHEGDSQALPHPFRQAYNASASQVADSSSNSATSPYLARPDVSGSRSFLDASHTSTAGEYSSSIAARVTTAPAARVSYGALHSPRYLGDRKRPRRRPSNVIPSMTDSARMLPFTPPLTQHADSGLRFSIGVQAQWEVPALPIGAPPAYAAT